MAQLLSERVTKFQFRYVSYPLMQHRFALPAARALECADSLGKAPEWIRTVSQQSSIPGLKRGGTVLINGWKFTGALSFAFLDSTVTALSRQ